MTNGNAKWFNPAKGFGFIEPENDAKYAFVHISAVERAGQGTLSNGQKVSYDPTPSEKIESSAENLSIID